MNIKTSNVPIPTPKSVSPVSKSPKKSPSKSPPLIRLTQKQMDRNLYLKDRYGVCEGYGVVKSKHHINNDDSSFYIAGGITDLPNQNYNDHSHSAKNLNKPMLKRNYGSQNSLKTVRKKLKL